MKYALALLALVAFSANAFSPGTPIRVDLRAGKPYTFSFKGTRGCVAFKVAGTTGTVETDVNLTLGSSSIRGRAQAATHLASEGVGNYRATVTAPVDTPVVMQFSDSPKTTIVSRNGSKSYCAG